MDWRNQAYCLVALILSPAALLALEVWDERTKLPNPLRPLQEEVLADQVLPPLDVPSGQPESVFPQTSTLELLGESTSSAIPSPDLAPAADVTIDWDAPCPTFVDGALQEPDSGGDVDLAIDWDAPCPTYVDGALEEPDLGGQADTTIDWNAPCWTYVFQIDDVSPAEDGVTFETPSLLQPAEIDQTVEQANFLPVGSFFHREIGTRIGWWGVDAKGDLSKVGEYQGLGSYPFLDLDMLVSDGTRTIDMFATGTDDEGTRLDFYYFGPKLSAEIDFEQFLHRLDHDPLSNLSTVTSTEQIVGEDLDPGEDYAVRIRELEAAVEGKLTEKVKFRVNFRARRKVGHRQTRAVQHCSGFDVAATPAGQCHVLSQGQEIDWMTVKVEPVVEAKLGPLVFEYSRPMRSFGHSDQMVARDYGSFHGAVLNGSHPYAMVPENFTQTDRIKLSAKLPEDTHFYGMLKIGNTHNKFRQTNRNFHGFDLRLTNRSIDGVSLTGFTRMQSQSNQLPPFLLAEEAQALARPTSVIPPYGFRRPIDYSRLTVGADASWRPGRSSHSDRGLSFTAGAEHGALDRGFSQRWIQGPPTSFIDHERTVFSKFHLGSGIKWSPHFDTFVRYKFRRNDDPLHATNQYQGYTNTSLPEREDRIEIGGTWVPGENFLATASLGIENRDHRSDVADFSEDDYPITCSLWYAPSPKSSLSLGYGYYSNWIDQEITFPSDDPNVEVGDTRRWSYGGRGQVLNIAGSYACSTRITLSAGVEYVWTHDAFDPLVPWPDLPYYSDVIVDRTRLTAGLDWLLYDDVSANFRYIFEDYEDQSVDYNSGTVQMFLVSVITIY